jgi:hypothetical protein
MDDYLDRPLWMDTLQKHDIRLDTETEKQATDRVTARMAAKLALRGHQLSRSHISSTEQPYCDDPKGVTRRTDPKAQERTLLVEMLVPCRKCAKCLQFRQLQWRQRCLTEINRANRTWFVTLTFAPVHLAGIMAESHKEKGRSQASRIDAAAYRHTQRYLKRLRKQSAVFRFMAVFELGEKTGRPHYHLLLNETGARPISKRTLESQWRSNVHCRLVDKGADGSASYITKYATKSADVRIRASSMYGKPLQIIS